MHYTEFKSLQYSSNWKQYGITNPYYKFDNGKLRPFLILRVKYNLPQSMHFLLFAMQHAIRAQLGEDMWVMSPKPIFNYLIEGGNILGFYILELLHAAANFVEGFSFQS